MEFKQLQSFAAVVKHESFTRAAQALYLSQPTVSTHVRQLETELGTLLVSRTTKTLEITVKGRELYEYAVKILELRDRMLESCAGESQKIIHLGASTIPSAYVLPELLPAYGRLCPEVYFVIHQSDSQGVLSGLRDGVFDIGLVGMEAEEEKLFCYPVCEDRMVLITPVNQRFLALKGQGSAALETLLKEPVILRERGSGSRKSAQRFLETMGIAEESLHVVARINDQEAVKNLVAGGVGVSIVSERAARNFLAEKRLLAFPLPAGVDRRHLYLAGRRGAESKGYVRQFGEFVTRFFENEESPEL